MWYCTLVIVELRIDPIEKEIAHTCTYMYDVFNYTVPTFVMLHGKTYFPNIMHTHLDV